MAIHPSCCIVEKSRGNIAKFSMALLLVSMLLSLLPIGTATASPIPPGGYTASCRDIYVGGNTLAANCRNFSQKYVPSQLDNFNKCVGDIFNNNGQLGCSFGQPIPAGSYQDSCSDVHIDSQNILHALCVRRNGDRYAASLPVADCHSTISNVNGHLNCDTNAPPGSYLQTCFDVHVVGDVLDAICDNNGSGSGNDGRTLLGNFQECISGGGKIVNSDGILECYRPGAGAVAAHEPDDPYNPCLGSAAPPPNCGPRYPDPNTQPTPLPGQGGGQWSGTGTQGKSLATPALKEKTQIMRADVNAGGQ